MKNKTIILADGRFPYGDVPLFYLTQAAKIICCDGSAENLLKYGIEPHIIVGDMDSISAETMQKYASIMHPSDDQETNDLTKAVEYCIEQNEKEVFILGATGYREDHAIGNIALLADYAKKIDISMVTNHGTFSAIFENTTFQSFPRQQISIFCLPPIKKISSENLVYPLENVSLDSWWKGTLNESTSETFELFLEEGARVIVFQTHTPKTNKIKAKKIG